MREDCLACQKNICNIDHDFVDRLIRVDHLNDSFLSGCDGPLPPREWIDAAKKASNNIC